MAKKNLSQPAVSAPQKPERKPKAEWDKLSEKGRRIISQAQEQAYKLAHLMKALGTFCANVDEHQNPELHAFAFSMSGLLEHIEREGFGVGNRLARLMKAELFNKEGGYGISDTRC